jgi:hypothetical protein
MGRTSRRGVLGFALLGVLSHSQLLPAHGHLADCAHCGCRTQRCRRICRLVCETRKITTTCWGMACEDVALPGPSEPACRHCEMVNPRTSEDRNLIAQAKRRVWISWRPSEGPDVATKRKLMKKTVSKTVPSYRWVVEEICGNCLAQLKPVAPPADAVLPPLPPVTGVQVIR